MADNQVATRPVDALKQVLANQSVQEQFQNALKENSGLFVSSLIELYSGDTYLQQCRPQLVVMEALKAATLKLPLNKNLGFAWIVPYNKSTRDGNGWKKELIPQFQIGWRGYEQLAMRTGQYININCGPVYEGELKKIDKLSGTVDISGEATSDVEVGYFAHFELVNGFKKTLYWTRDKAEKHALKYNPECKKAGKLTGNWNEHFSSRAASTVLKHLIKNFGIMSVEMEQAFKRDEDTASAAFEAEYTELANSTPLIPENTEPDVINGTDEIIDQETGEVLPPNQDGAAEAVCPFPVG